MLTFLVTRLAPAAERAFKKWHRGLTQRGQGPVEWFKVWERGAGGRWHYHCLLEGTGNLEPDAISGTWKEGRSTVSAFDPKKGAIHYMTKFVDDPEADYDLSKGLAKHFEAEE